MYGRNKIHFGNLFIIYINWGQGGVLLASVILVAAQMGIGSQNDILPRNNLTAIKSNILLFLSPRVLRY